MIDSVTGVDPARRARLMQVLDIDPEWRMHRVSDGQRRRVQICLGLLHPFQVEALTSACAPFACMPQGCRAAFCNMHQSTRLLKHS